MKDARRSTGTVRHWSHKGFGFITSDDAGQDIFCHRSGVRKRPGIEEMSLLPGQRVDFVIAQGPKGLCAIDTVATGQRIVGFEPKKIFPNAVQRVAVSIDEDEPNFNR
jgi:cold shock protein